jgi:hypothetical protein
MLLNDYVINKARANLEHFVLAKAHRLAKDLGFSYIESDNAPNNFDELEQAFKHSMNTKAPLPVFSGASENTIYLSKEGNWSFRFWHDVVHTTHGYKLTLEDEIKCSSIQCEEVAKYFGEHSLESKLFIADTIGQSVYAYLHNGSFPEHQLNFVKSLIKEH